LLASRERGKEGRPQENNELQTKLSEMESKLLGGKYYMGSCLIMSLYDYFCGLVFSATGEV
jgi:hypothetical protein